MNILLTTYLVSAIIVFAVGCYEAYTDYNRGIPIKLTSGILGYIFLTSLPAVNTLIVIFLIFYIICDNPTILKGKQ